MFVQRYAVFDCTKIEGYAFTRVPFAGFAKTLSYVMTFFTGRFHDYDTDD